MDWVIGLLFLLHIGGAIAAFGPTFTFPIIGTMSGAEPMHSNFALRLTERIEGRLVVPLALFQAVTGVALIWVIPIDVFQNWWLLLAIVLYVAALAIVFTNQIPVTRRLIEATGTPPPPPAAGEARPAGPPPHIAAMVKRVQQGGIATSVMLVLIIILMILGTNHLLF